MIEGESSLEEDEDVYVRVKVLGRGAFGEAVLYRKSQNLVVWKEVDLGRVKGREEKEVRNEMEILCLLHHPNIVAYFNHYFSDNMLYIEMEYCNDGDMYHKILAQEGQGLFPEATVLWYTFQLLSAVHHLHSRGILHRDIKTLNIFMMKTGLLKLGDFGMSKLLDSGKEMAETVVGTPYYMSPELIKGETDVIAKQKQNKKQKLNEEPSLGEYILRK